MPKCIVHAGMHDTGAALIQQALNGLNTGTHYYAQLAETPNHSAALRTMFVTEPGAGADADAEAMRKKASAARDKLAAEIVAAGNRTLVLSAEALPQFPDAALEAFHAFLVERNVEPVIAAYVADPVSLMTGGVQRKLMNGNPASVSALGAYPNYKRKFTRIDTVFGRGNVILWKFDPAADIVADFCRRCDIPRPVAAVAGDAPAHLARPAAVLLYRLAQLRQRWPAAAEDRPAEKHLRIALSRLAGPPFSLSPALLQPVLEEKAADIVWMESRLGEPLAMEPGEEKPGAVRSETDLRLTRGEIKAVVRQLRASDIPPGEAGRKRMLRLLADVFVSAQPEDNAAWKGALDGAPAAAAAEPAAKKAPKGKQAKRKAPAAPPSIFSADSKQAKPPRGPQPVLQAPLPLLNKDKRLIVLWSPKSACTTAYVWFSHFSGFSDEVRRYAAWPHRHRIEQFQRSPFFTESAKADHADFRVLRIIRDPYSRAVSIYRHALHTQFAIAPMRNWSKGKISAETGYSFQTFLDLVAHLDLSKADIHFRPQFHAFETERKPDRIINISKQDLVTELGHFEEQLGFARTNFGDLDWLHSLESKRKAKQEPIEGDALDTVPFTRHQVHELNHFPNYSQLLTPKAKKRIEALYEVDFNAYGEYL